MLVYYLKNASQIFNEHKKNAEFEKTRVKERRKIHMESLIGKDDTAKLMMKPQIRKNMTSKKEISEVR